MALISSIAIELTIMTNGEERTGATIARMLREARLLSQKGRGRGAAKATPLDAARLLIAMMIRPQVKEARQVVEDFGGLVCTQVVQSKDNVAPGIDLHWVAHLAEGHRLEEALAALIGLWDDEAKVEALEEAHLLRGLWPAMGVAIAVNGLTADLWIGGMKYAYMHPTQVAVNADVEGHSNDRPVGTASRLAWKRLDEVFARYRSEILTSHTITTDGIRSLGEVVADRRRPGFRGDAAERAVYVAGKSNEEGR